MKPVFIVTSLFVLASLISSASTSALAAGKDAKGTPTAQPKQPAPKANSSSAVPAYQVFKPTQPNSSSSSDLPNYQNRFPAAQNRASSKAAEVTSSGENKSSQSSSHPKSPAFSSWAFGIKPSTSDAQTQSSSNYSPPVNASKH